MSTQVSLKTVSIDHYINNLDKVTKIVGKAAADVEANAKNSITRSGGRYRKYGNHWSSRPGKAPNNDTGNLAGSIMHQMKSRTSAVVYVVAKYAVPLEFGWTNKGGNTVPPRPFLNPALEKVKPAFVKALTKVLKGK